MTEMVPLPRKQVSRVSFSLLYGVVILGSSIVNAQPERISVVGPLEQIDCLTREFSVLGVRFDAAKSASFDQLCSQPSSGGTAYLAAGGIRSAGGVAKLSHLGPVRSEIYVPGGSTVFIRGIVSDSRPSTGDFAVAGTWVQSHSGQVPEIGTEVEVLGIQPLPSERIVATHFSSTPSENGGKATDAIIGSGKSASAIIGSGASTQAIIGSGKSANAIIGSGRQTSAIIGSGSTAHAIIGSGVSAQAIIGSGKSTSAIIGSGLQANAIIGSGRQTSAVIGSGRLSAE
jgi:hypothetical protein